jgi:diguanylate cyclase (GGDEF)-like protein
MKSVRHFLATRPPRTLGVVGVLAIVLTGLLDYLSGYELSTEIFYVVPVAAIAWYGSDRMGKSLAVLAAVAWTLSDLASGHIYTHRITVLWNGLIGLSVLLLIAFLTARLHHAMEELAQAADTDFLTGMLNARAFHARLTTELTRARRWRRPFSLAYLDIDNFKRVNDVFGHAAGDHLLVAVARILKEEVRATDAAARLGGDEFALLFSETGVQRVRPAFAHIHERLTLEAAQHNWPVTFSVGVITFDQPPPDSKQALTIADTLMYSVKNDAKNRVAYQTWC